MIEAAPNPAPGPERDTLVATSQARVKAAEDAMTTALHTYLNRVQGVVLSRVKGPRARKGTRWWGETAKKSLFAPVALDGLEYKSLDAAYVLPDKLVAEASGVARPVALRVAYDAAAHTAQTLGVRVPDDAGDHGMFAIDHDALNAAVEDAVNRLTDVAAHHAAMIREAILGADSSSDTLDEVLDKIEAAHEKGGNWVLMAGRSLTNGLINDASIGQARALGVTHAQWLSRRDPKVRPTHAIADGQVRPIGEDFQVGAFKLAHPCDPKDLPASWEEVANCRCGLSFIKPDEGTSAALNELAKVTPGQSSDAADRLLKRAAETPEAPVPRGVPADADGMLPVAHQLTTTEPVTAYRAMSQAIDAVSGQWITLAGPIVLGLAAPSVIAAGAPVLSVLIPAGTAVTVAGGVVVLAQGTALSVLASGPTGAQVTVA